MFASFRGGRHDACVGVGVLSALGCLSCRLWSRHHWGFFDLRLSCGWVTAPRGRNMFVLG